MNLDFPNRVENVRLSKANCLLPVFEAIVNSIHGIEDSGRNDGVIDVTVERDAQPQMLGEEFTEKQRIKDFIIADNGVGFTEENYRSFETSDTSSKKSKGGKGVGRLLWLKAFDHADVE